jgi:hypothetical protein
MVRWATAAVLVAGGVVLALLLTKMLERVVDGLMLRVGEVWTLGIVVAATIVLGTLWLRHGGTRVVRWFGIVLKPARSHEEAAGPDTGSENVPPLVGPRR